MKNCTVLPISPEAYYVIALRNFNQQYIAASSIGNLFMETRSNYCCTVVTVIPSYLGNIATVALAVEYKGTYPWVLLHTARSKLVK